MSQDLRAAAQAVVAAWQSGKLSVQMAYEVEILRLALAELSEPDLLPGLKRAWKIADRNGAIVTAMQLGAEIARIEKERQ